MESEATTETREFIPTFPESRILEVLRNGENYTVEEILEQTPEISWAQLFLAMDSLSRCGKVELHREGFLYTITKAKSSAV